MTGQKLTNAGGGTGGGLPEESEAVRSQLWLTFSLASRHVNPGKKYNEHNPGVGLELRLGRWSIVFGAYKNSLSVNGDFKRTVYGGIEFKPLRACFTDLAKRYPKMIQAALQVSHENGFDIAAQGCKVRYGLGVGYVTGYINRFPKLPLPVVIGTFDFENANTAFNVLVLPNIPRFSPLTFGFRGKARLNDDALPDWAQLAMHANDAVNAQKSGQKNLPTNS